MDLWITYYMSYEKPPWNPDPDGGNTWVLVCQVMTKSTGHVISRDVVALFNLDSEAETFQRFLIGGGKVVASDEMVELVRAQERR